VLVTASASTTPAFAPAAGYDLATGLGSMNVTNLAAAWKTTVGAFQGSLTSLTLNGAATPVTITHGTAVTAAVTVGPAVAGTTQPTGDVSLIASTTGNVAVGSGTLNGLNPDVASFTTTTLPGGSYTVKAHYAGDATFAPSDDPTGVSVTVNKEASNLQLGIVTLDSTGNPLMTNATSFVYGSPYILRVDVLNSTGTAANCQPLTAGGVVTGCAHDATGTVTLTDNGKSLDGGTFALNSQGNVEDHLIELTGGAHTLSATYSGDVSYNVPVAPVNDSVTVVAAGTTTSMSPVPGPVGTGKSVTLTANIASTSGSTHGPTGTVTFFSNGTTQVGGPVTVVPTGASATGPAGGTASLLIAFSTAGTESITATYSGDTNYATSTTTAPITFTVTNDASFSVSGSAAAVAAGSSASSTVTVTPNGGYTGTVNVSCDPTSLPPGVTCSPSSVAINVTNTSPATGNLTLAVAAPSSTTSASLLPQEQKIYWAGLAPILSGPTPGKTGWWGLSAFTSFAAIFLVLLSGRRRYRTALAFGLACALTFIMGCGGGSTGGGGAVPTTTKLTVASTKVPQGTVSFTVNVASSGKSPAGSVQLYDGSSLKGNPTALSGGSATISIPDLAVGTHAISAHYLGDAFTQTSQSGTLNITITGQTNFTVVASPTSSNGPQTVTLTIN
jgi:Bacterial Ig-like domain (group 3)